MRTYLFLVISIFVLSLFACTTDPSFPAQQSGFITGADSAQIYYKMIGAKKDTIVVVHGGPGAGMNSFFHVVEPLAKDFTLIFYDQRGGGRSTLPKDTTKLKPEYYVEDLEALRQHFGLKGMNILAHSFGSILVAEYVRKYPDHIKRAVFHKGTGPVRSEMATYYRSKARQSKTISDTLLTKRTTELLTSLLNGTASDPIAACLEYEQLSAKIARMQGNDSKYLDSTCEMPPKAVKYYYQYTAQLAPSYFGNWNYTNELDAFNAPLLVIYGAEDTLAQPSQRSWINITPNSRLLWVPNASESAITDQPEFVHAAITDFFNGRWP